MHPDRQEYCESLSKFVGGINVRKGIVNEEQWSAEPISNYFRRMMYLTVRVVKSMLQDAYCVTTSQDEVHHASLLSPEDVNLMSIYYQSAHSDTWRNTVQYLKLS